MHLRMRQLARVAVTLAAVLTGSIGPLMAQGAVGDLSQRAPQFLATHASRTVPVDVSKSAVLQRRIAVDVRGLSLGDALVKIGESSGLRFAYSRLDVPVTKPVRLQAQDITVAAALTEVLLGLGVDVVLGPQGQAMLIKRGASVPRSTGSITGRVTDAKTGDRIVGAEVWLDGTRWRAVSGDNGYYRLTDVEAGGYTLVVRRVGYGKQSRSVTVTATQELTADLALQPIPTQLNEIVTTVTGDQRRIELGHVVGVINADSVVKEAPVTNISELLNGRVPGLQVFQNQGTVGGTVHLQIRGPNSLFLNTEPIVIVDGVRYASGHVTVQSFCCGLTGESTSPLNDLNPNDIESVEVVKGSSAATLYGTDASNGVIVIKTKRGKAGPARWNAYGKGAYTEIAAKDFPDIVIAYGHTPSGGVTSSCNLLRVAAGTCTQDSVVTLRNPLNDPELTIFHSQPRWESGLNVSGGRQDLRYYFGGDFERAVGALQMPPAIVEQLKQQRGVSELPEEQREPNAFRKVNLRANVTAGLAERAELRVNTGYIHSSTRSLSYSSPYLYAGSTRPNLPYGDSYPPSDAFSQTSTELTDRFVGSAGTEWRAAPWLVTRGTFGVDLGTRNINALIRPGQSQSFPGYLGAVEDSRLRQTATTADVNMTASFRHGRLSSRTSVGAQYVRNLADGLGSYGYELPPGGTSVGEAANIGTQQTYAETVTLGSYLEETVGVNDRLFLTAALRVDGASAFGQNYDAATYPKVSASWLVSDEPFMPRVPGLDELRVRYAFGASGQQPTPSFSLPTYRSRGVFDENGNQLTAIGVTALGNPNLRPERVREHEFGFDATGVQGRVQVGLTWYTRRTTDQIVPITLPSGLGGSVYTNLGLTTQHGFEAELAGKVFESDNVSLDVTYRYALHRTKLVDIGSGVESRYSSGGLAEGYPLGARFMNPIAGYDDANGDGIIIPGEIQLGPKTYIGESTPPTTHTVSAVIGLFHRRVRLSTLLERRTGYSQVDYVMDRTCGDSRCPALFDPSRPIAEQVEAAAIQISQGDFTFVSPGDFTRWREMTVAVDAPVAVARALRVRSLTASLAGRNLALWTKFRGADPESANVDGASGGFAAGIPQGRSWTLRLDLGL